MGDEDDFYPEDTGGWLYYVIHTAVLIYGIGFILTTVLFTNATVAHGFMFGREFGRYHSERYVSLWWLSLFFQCMRFFTFLALCCVVWFRNDRCCGNPRFCRTFWYTVLLCLMMVDLFSLAMMGMYMEARNSPTRPGQRFNPANDILWCCDPHVFNNPANKCPNTFPCNPPRNIPQMTTNPDFLWLFVVNCVTGLFDVVVIFFPIVRRLSNDSVLKDGRLIFNADLSLLRVDRLFSGSTQPKGD